MFSHPGPTMTMKSKQGNFSNHLATFPRISEFKEPVQEILAWSNHSYAVLQPMAKMSYKFNHNQNVLLGKVFSPRPFHWKIFVMWHHRARSVGLWPQSLSVAVCKHHWKFWNKGRGRQKWSLCFNSELNDTQPPRISSSHPVTAAILLSWKTKGPCDGPLRM